MEFVIKRKAHVSHKNIFSSFSFKNTKLYEETKLCTFQYYPLVSIKWFQMWKVHLKLAYISISSKSSGQKNNVSPHGFKMLRIPMDHKWSSGRSSRRLRKSPQAKRTRDILAYGTGWVKSLNMLEESKTWDTLLCPV